ncbi:MAG: hypothetical protein C1943_12755 [Halochromatium sp.]|nr:hypothetical protein [Halochromatium sp.]
MVSGLILLPLPHSAHAYIGPGAGLGALVAALAVVIALVLLFIGFLWYPLKRLIRGRKRAADNNIQKDD